MLFVRLFDLCLFRFVIVDESARVCSDSEKFQVSTVISCLGPQNTVGSKRLSSASVYHLHIQVTSVMLTD